MNDHERDKIESVGDDLSEYLSIIFPYENWTHQILVYDQLLNYDWGDDTNGGLVQIKPKNNENCYNIDLSKLLGLTQFNNSDLMMWFSSDPLEIGFYYFMPED